MFFQSPYFVLGCIFIHIALVHDFCSFPAQQHQSIFMFQMVLIKLIYNLYLDYIDLPIEKLNPICLKPTA